MKRWIGSGILVLGLALGVLAGCNDNNSGAQPENPRMGTQNQGEQRSDLTITAELKAKITDDELLDNTDVSVDTTNGVVTLTGTVATDAQMERATELARNTAGVTSVNSRLTLKPETSATGELKESAKEVGRETKDAAKDVTEKAEKEYGELKEESLDAKITSEVKIKFAADDTVKALNIDVDTENGFVTLRGTVNSKEELSQALKIARSVSGVKEVKSELQIANQ